MGADVRHGPVQQGIQAVHAAREQRRVLVIRLHDEPAAFECDEILRQRQRDATAVLAERGISDDVLVQFLDEGDPRILDAPQFFGIAIRLGPQRRRRVDDPSVDAVGRSGGAEV